MLIRFLTTRRAVTSIEYAIIASLIAVVIVASVSRIGSTLNGAFSSVNAGFTTATTAPSSPPSSPPTTNNNPD